MQHRALSKVWNVEPGGLAISQQLDLEAAKKLRECDAGINDRAADMLDLAKLLVHRLPVWRT